MEKLMFMTRWDWAVWGWHHPWTLAITPTLIAALYIASKVRKGDRW